jgi:peptide/nickel transport system permease protein
VRLARANGIPGRAIVFIYALKQAGLRVVTLLGLTVVGLLTGTVLVENVFALPGLGTAIVTGVEQRDVPVVQGITLFFTLIIILTNLAVDLVYVVLDPRVRRGGAIA